jgi:hypothetical protein
MAKHLSDVYGRAAFDKAWATAYSMGAHYAFDSGDDAGTTGRWSYPDGRRVDIEALILADIDPKLRPHFQAKFRGTGTDWQSDAGANGFDGGDTGAASGGLGLGVSAGDSNSSSSSNPCHGVEVMGVCVTPDMVQTFSDLSQH